MELRQGGSSADWFFLAIAQWQLGIQDAPPPPKKEPPPTKK